MAKHRETGMDRLKKLPLWQWGAIFIFAGMMANMVMGLQPTPIGTAAARGQAMGRGVATGVFVIAGMGMMLVDLLRKKPEPEKKSKKGKVRSE
jgi:hypothetical protein